jgi:hypothetical protein
MFVAGIMNIRLAGSYTPVRLSVCLPSYLQLNCYAISLLTGDDRMNSCVFQLTIVPILAAVARVRGFMKVCWVVFKQLINAGCTVCLYVGDTCIAHEFCIRLQMRGLRDFSVK